MKYNLLYRATAKPIEGVTIDESAKKDFMEMMDWKEDDWDCCTSEVKE